MPAHATACRLLQMLLTSLDSTVAAPAAAVAIRHLCDACGQQMRACVDVLMQLYSRVLSSGAAASLQANGSTGLSSTSGSYTAGSAMALRGSLGVSAVGGQHPAPQPLQVVEDDVQLVLEGVCLCISR